MIPLKVKWEIFHKIINKNKVTCILPLIQKYIYLMNIEEKASIFKEFFAKQRSLLVNESELPNSLPYRTNKRSSMVP